MSRGTTRRDFLRQSTLAGVGFWAAGGIALQESRAANEKLNVAIIGAGGQGGGNLGNVAGLGVNIVALCDVDEDRASNAFKTYTKAEKYHDYRIMLEKQKNIDAVVVSTPDHNHAPAAVRAMKLKKHVYCEKPLTWSVQEARIMRELAAKQKVATQMGNQGTSHGGLRRAVEEIQSGIIGKVSEAHIWTNRPIWPQAIDRPKDVQEIPATMKWNLWLGPAPGRPYHKAYAPFAWRGWLDYGTGALGDMGCHTANMAFMALKLKYPKTVAAENGPINNETFPGWAHVTYEFPARGDMPACKVHWYEGRKDGTLVQPPSDLASKFTAPKKGSRLFFKKNGEVMWGDPNGRAYHPESGSLLVGDKGILFSPNDYGSDSFILREGTVQHLSHDPKKLPRSPGHHREWINACKGGKPAMSNFSYAGVLTEFILLGNVAMRAGVKLEWDGDKLCATNCKEADKFIKRDYRKGWEVEA